jgi:hypothetical protein
MPAPKDGRRRPDLGQLRPGATPWLVMECLREHGHQTAHQVAESIGANLRTVTSILSAQKGVRCRIVRYERPTDFYAKARAVWSYGTQGTTKRKPRPLTPTEVDRRYSARLRPPVNSVWALGARPAVNLGARACTA